MRAHRWRIAAAAARDIATAQPGPLLLQQPGALSAHSSSLEQGYCVASTTLVTGLEATGASLVPASLAGSLVALEVITSVPVAASSVDGAADGEGTGDGDGAGRAVD